MDCNKSELYEKRLKGLFWVTIFILVLNVTLFGMIRCEVQDLRNWCAKLQPWLEEDVKIHSIIEGKEPWLYDKKTGKSTIKR